MRTQAEWDHVYRLITELHEDGERPQLWVDDRDIFVGDMMEFMQSSYMGGYQDALTETVENAERNCDAIEATLKFVRE